MKKQEFTLIERINSAKDNVKYHQQYALIDEINKLPDTPEGMIKAHKLLSKHGF